jgi:hypothetical protein
MVVKVVFASASVPSDFLALMVAEYLVSQSSCPSGSQDEPSVRIAPLTALPPASVIATWTSCVPSTVKTSSAEVGTSVEPSAGALRLTFGGSGVSPGAFHFAPGEQAVAPMASATAAAIKTLRAKFLRAFTLRINFSSRPPHRPWWVRQRQLRGDYPTDTVGEATIWDAPA